MPKPILETRLLEIPVDNNTTLAQVGNVVKDGRRHINGSADTLGALVNNLSSGRLAPGSDGNPSAADSSVVRVGVIAVLGGGESNDGVARVVSPSAGAESLYIETLVTVGHGVSDLHLLG